MFRWSSTVKRHGASHRIGIGRVIISQNHQWTIGIGIIVHTHIGYRLYRYRHGAFPKITKLLKDSFTQCLYHASKNPIHLFEPLGFGSNPGPGLKVLKFMSPWAVHRCFPFCCSLRRWKLLLVDVTWRHQCIYEQIKFIPKILPKELFFRSKEGETQVFRKNRGDDKGIPFWKPWKTEDSKQKRLILKPLETLL